MQEKLFGVEIPKEEIKQKKPARKRAKIVIGLLDNPKLKYSVDFEGYNEGSGTPCKDEAEVMEKVERLRTEYKEKYILEVIDERAKQTKIRDLVKDKKVRVLVKYDLDSEDKRSFFVSDNRNELGIQSYLGGAHSSGFGEKTLEEKEKEAVDWVIKDIMEDGVPRENIEIVKEEMTEEDLKKHNEWKAERRKNELKWLEKEIKRLSEELKEALKKKFQKDVILQYGVKE